jgi:hypothetical protein
VGVKLALARSLGLRPKRGARQAKQTPQEDRQVRIAAREQPPACPPGWSIGPPDFVIMGAEKAGTSRWLRLLEAHPDIYHRARVSELHFFDDFADRWPSAADVDRYFRFFPRPPGGLAGEKTPMYMTLFWAPRMLAEVAPDARILVIVRDPVERYLSGRSFAERYREQSRASGATEASFTRRAVETAFARGLYATQLGWILDAYPRRQLLVLQYERCTAEPLAEIARTFSFLGLPNHTPSDELLGQRVNPGTPDRVPIEPQRRELIARLYEPEVMRLRELVPDLDLALWPSYTHLA